MLNRLIRFSLTHRLVIVCSAALLVAVGGYALSQLHVDVFPDLNRPVVTIFAEAPGMAPEEVEVLVSQPIETSVNGAPDVERVRSVATAGLALVFVEFGWGSDIYRNRQVVTERLQLAAPRLPAGVIPTLGPISSIMGEVMLIGLTADPAKVSPMDLRTLADWTIRPRLLSVPGISQVTVIGGQVKQYQMLLDPNRLTAYGLGLNDVQAAVTGSNVNTTGGYLNEGQREYVVRNLGRITSVEDLANSVVTWRTGVPVFLRDLGRAALGGQVKRGDASINASPGVILSVQKQPNADTITVTEEINKALTEMRAAIPAGVQVQPNLFRQAAFIRAAVRNVQDALRDGSIIVLIILFLFLLNFRTTAITLTAIPLSFLTAATVLSWFGASVNTMTLGGLAIAIGELVDDAIVDVENVFRRLRENRQRPDPLPAIDVVFAASSEIRGSIVYATVIVMLAFVPLFFLQGLEGRLLAPLGLAYVVSVAASLLVSLTLTPVLCSYLLPHAKATERRGDSPVVKRLKQWDLHLLNFSLDNAGLVLGCALLAFLIALASVALLGREFLPPFNESSVTVNVIAPPGTSLEESNVLGTQAEQAILKLPQVLSTGRRTGRAELDEHAEGVHYTEIEVVPEGSERTNQELMNRIRTGLSSIPGVELNIGQPISHRLDHLLSGVRAQVAVKIFGRDLQTLMAKAAEAKQQIARVPGVVDLSVEKQVAIPQVQIIVNRAAAAQYGMRAGEVADALSTALNGRIVSNVIEGQATFAAIVRLDEPYRNSVESLRQVLLDGSTPGMKVPLTAVAEVRTTTGPNQILHENGLRRIVVQCNVFGRDLGSVVDDIRATLTKGVKLPEGYFITYGGQFESQQDATRLIMFLSIFALAGIFVVLFAHFRSAPIALQIMMNVPMAIIGGVVAVALSGGTLSVASLVGFVTLAGISSRNGIMMLSHYLHLMKYEGEVFGRPMIIRGSLERLVPVLMTALATALALLPLAFSRGQAGREILQPVAIVILGGLVASTFLDQAVTPALFYLYGRRMFARGAEQSPTWTAIPGAPPKAAADPDASAVSHKV